MTNRPNIRRKPVRKAKNPTAPKTDSVRSRRSGTDYPFVSRYIVKGARP